MNLYAATGNQGKLSEFAASASSAGIAVLALPGLAVMPEPVEDAATFMGNAELKARAYSLLAPRLMVFADDSGLEVDALNGAPGVRSARYADDAAYDLNSTATRDQRNNAFLLKQLGSLSHSAPAARFVCALALAQDGKILLRATGSIQGEILLAPRGQGGFGYDPLFLLPSLALTMAEIPREQKWALSHRGNAFRSLLAQLRSSPIP